jgi:hypothetical protein
VGANALGTATVEAGVPSVDTTTVEGMIAERILTALPLDDRDLFKAAILVPGVAPTPSSSPSLLPNGKAGQVSVNDMRGRKSRNGVHVARPPGGSGGDSKWQVWQDFGIPKSWLTCLESGGREGIRTPGLLVANGESLKLRRVATIS